ncbi:MAG: alpha/beta hydrolase, partial [Dehalococcoidia bacterium]
MGDERVTISNGEVTLEGALRTPDGQPPFPGVVLCHPHPQYGGDMSNNIVMAMAQGLNGRGIATLRFNFRGVGASTGV